MRHPALASAPPTILFDDGREEVRLEDWQAGKTIRVINTRGLEFIVLSGGLTIGGDTLEPQSWGRLPADADLTATVGPQGARIWLKDAPLLHPDVLSIPE